MLSAFLAGLRSRRPAVLIVAILVFAASALFLEWFVRSGTVGLLPRAYLMRNGADLFTVIFHDLANLRRRPPRERQVYVVGGSAMTYAFHPDELSALLRREGHPVRVHNFSLGRQSVHESLSIVDNLPPGSGVVLMGINPRILSRRIGAPYERWRQHHLMLHSPARDELMRREGMDEWASPILFPHIVWRIKHQLWIHRRSYLAGRLVSFRNERPFYRAVPHDPEHRRKKIEAFARRNLAGYEKHRLLNLRGFEAVSSLARSRGLEIVLVELPVCGEAVEAMGADLWSRYRKDVRDLADKLALPVWDYEGLTIPEEHFLDAVHVLAPARAAIQVHTLRYFDSFADKLS